MPSSISRFSSLASSGFGTSMMGKSLLKSSKSSLFSSLDLFSSWGASSKSGLSSLKSAYSSLSILTTPFAIKKL